MLKPAALLVLMLGGGAFVDHAEAKSVSVRHFAPGQEWSINSASPTTAKVIIGRVEKWKGRIAVHVSIIDIPIPKGMTGAGGAIRIGHVAFDKLALAASVDRLLATGISPASSFDTGYQQWNNDQGDLTTMSVSQIIALGLAAMNRVH
jgi:hypothetical protein